MNSESSYLVIVDRAAGEVRIEEASHGAAPHGTFFADCATRGEAEAVEAGWRARFGRIAESDPRK